MIILEEQTGLNAGLNKGLKIGKMLKKNVRLRNVSLKNAVKVGKAIVPVASMAMSIIPGGGIVSKVLDSKVGKLITKVKGGKAVKFATKIGKSKVGKFAINKFVKPTVKNAFAGIKAQSLQPIQSPEKLVENTTPEQLQTIAQVKGVTVESLQNTPLQDESLPNDAQLETISQVKDIPVEDLKQEVQSQKETIENSTGVTPTDKPNYTIPIVIGVGAVGAILLATSSKSN
jgi:hypothetical protein